MNTTKQECESARSTLAAELALLKAKVANGQTLRVGERRFLLGIVDEADAMKNYALGARAVADEFREAMCPACKGATYQRYRQILAEQAAV